MEVNKRLIILGAGGHGKVAADCAEQTKLYTEIAFLDQQFPEKKNIEHWSIVGTPENALHFNDPSTVFFVAIGDNRARKTVLDSLLRQNLNITSLIHPSAVVSPHVKISPGVIVCANATINPMSEIGVGAIVNTAASVDHDCLIGDYVHVSVGARLAGTISVGNGSFIGIGSTVIQCINIGKHCMVGAGAALINDLPENSTAVGVPAKVINTIKTN